MRNPNAIFFLYRLLPCSFSLMISSLFQNILRFCASDCWRKVYLVINVQFQINIVKYSSATVQSFGMNPGHSFPRTFVPTRFLTGPDIRAHIKWPPRTFVLTSNDHPGHLCSYQITTPDIRAHINFISYIYSKYMLIPSYLSLEVFTFVCLIFDL